MKKIITTMFATIITASAITTVNAVTPSSAAVKDHMCHIAADSSQSCLINVNQDKRKKHSGEPDGTDDGNDLKKETISKIQNIEKEMYESTHSVREVLEKERVKFNAAMKSDELTDAQRIKLKDEYYEKNCGLIAELDQMQQPYLERIKKVQKNYVDSVFLY